jgi:hypothetical protein
LSGTTDRVGYQWFVNGAISTNDTNAALSVDAFDSTSTVTYLLQITESNGCTNTDAVSVTSHPKYQLNLDEHYEICLDDSLTLTIDSTLTAINWNFGSADYAVSIREAGSVYLSYEDTFGCQFMDSTLVVVHSLPNIKLKDTSYCVNSATLIPGSFRSYLWNDSSSQNSLTIDTSGTYSVEVSDSNGCTAQTSIQVNLYSPVVQRLGNDTTHCGPLALNFNTTGRYLWSTLDTTSNVLISKSGLLELTFTDTNNCTTKDSINITLLDIPVQSWSDTVQYCSNTSVTLTSDPFSSYLWNTKATTQSIEAGTGFYSIEFTGFNGCKNKDTVQVQINPIPSVSLGNDTTLCGDSLLLTIPAGESYLWSTGDTLNYTSINTTMLCLQTLISVALVIQFMSL